MGLIDLLFGPLCPRCSVRSKGPVHKLGDSWICQSCHEKAEAEEKRQQEEKRQEEEKRQQSPDYQLESVLPPLLAAAHSRAEPSTTERLQRLCARFDVEWKNAGISWRTKAKTEALLIPSLASADPQMRKVAVKLLSVVGFVPSVPKLIPLLSEESLVDDVLATIARIGQCFSGGWGTCPRCGSTNTQEGNSTGWRCKNCNLEYNPHGSRDPLAFIATGGSSGSPWRRKDMSDLLDEILALRSDGGGAPTIRIEKTRTLAQRAEAIAAMRADIVDKLGN